MNDLLVLATGIILIILILYFTFRRKRTGRTTVTSRRKSEDYDQYDPKELQERGMYGGIDEKAEKYCVVFDLETT